MSYRQFLKRKCIIVISVITLSFFLIASTKQPVDSKNQDIETLKTEIQSLKTSLDNLESQLEKNEENKIVKSETRFWSLTNIIIAFVGLSITLFVIIIGYREFVNKKEIEKLKTSLNDQLKKNEELMKASQSETDQLVKDIREQKDKIFDSSEFAFRRIENFNDKVEELNSKMALQSDESYRIIQNLSTRLEHMSNILLEKTNQSIDNPEETILRAIIELLRGSENSEDLAESLEKFERKWLKNTRKKWFVINFELDLFSDNPEKRISAIHYFGLEGDKEIISKIENMLELEKHEIVKKAAEDALEEINNRISMN